MAPRGSDAATELRRVEITPGFELEYADHGEGRPVVFLHGYTDSWRSFESVLECLPPGLRGLAPSQRGHGSSSRPEESYAIERFAADAVAFLDRLGIASAVLVGHSMGSLVVQEVARTHPERVTHLLLVGAATTFDNPGVRELAAAVAELRDPIPRAFVTEFQASTVHRALRAAVLERMVDESLKVPARVWRAVAEGLLAPRREERLASIAAPTLVVWGDQDGIAPREEQERLLEAIPDARLVVYEGTGHAPHWEEPDRFVRDLVAAIA